jgi:hypothetical protein
MGILTVEQQRRANRAKKRHPVTVDGQRFADRREADLFLELRTLQRAGTIADLRRHAKLPLMVNGILVDTYTALFSFRREGQKVLVVTGWQSDLQKLQKKLVEAIYGITVMER